MEALVLQMRATSILVAFCALALAAAGGYVAVRCTRGAANRGPAWALLAAAGLAAGAALARVVWVWGIGTFWRATTPDEVYGPLMIARNVMSGATFALAGALLAFRVRPSRRPEDRHA